MTSVLRGFALAILAGVVAVAQSPATSRVDAEFDAASIKPNRSGSSRTSVSMPPVGTLRTENVTLRELITDAYRVRRFQVEGGPDWVDGDRFDITARTGEGAAPDRMHVMLQALLVERFGLTFHRETRERPIYALAVARADGVPSPSLVRSTGAERPGMESNGVNGFMMIRAKGQSMAQLAARLGNQTDRLIVDRTGLSGAYDFELQYTRDDGLTRSDQPAGAASLFTALREQLGLKLESARGPVEFLVIDTASRPTPD
jgi:uncharacterized protein (TIGR03435 family)